jgi:hypothetical protein
MPDQKQPIVNDVAAPAIAMHTNTIATDTSKNEEPGTEDTKLVSNIGTNIAPPESAPSVPDNTEATAAIDDKTADTKDTKPTEVPSEKTGPASPYEAVDSLPDMSEKKTTELTDQMEGPRIYDTKEYVVPIKDTMHSHGTLGKILAGIISAVIVVGGLVAAVYFLV